jgi:hypothetical protein
VDGLLSPGDPLKDPKPGNGRGDGVPKAGISQYRWPPKTKELYLGVAEEEKERTRAELTIAEC